MKKRVCTNYPYIEIKTTDQLRSYNAAELCLCILICKRQMSHGATEKMKTIAAVLCFHTSYEIHKDSVALSYIISSSFHNESPYTVTALNPEVCTSLPTFYCLVLA